MSQPIITEKDLEPIIQEPCTLFDPEGVEIGTISCDHVLNRLRVKISDNKLKGYYLVFRGTLIEINERGMLSSWPEGFFSLIETQLSKLLCWD